jgi:hypothetical protein
MNSDAVSGCRLFIERDIEASARDGKQLKNGRVR